MTAKRNDARTAAKTTRTAKPANTKETAMPAKPAPAANPATPAAKPAAKPAPANCGCGCGLPTVTEKALFLSGHDARFAGRVGRGEIEPTDAQRRILADSPRLQAKVEGIRATAAKKAAAKAAREAAKKAAKAAYDEAMAKA